MSLNCETGGSDGKESACNVSDAGSIPGPGRFPGEGNGYPLQYSCLENPMNKGAQRATVHRVAKSQDITERLTLSLFLLSLEALPCPFPTCSCYKIQRRTPHPSQAQGDKGRAAIQYQG